ncbi:MAG: hypothetical protein EBR42_10085, partial [Betaproteobacteria bacterium]|nr:hypothetical protein [Betaproteobacteria bacterium]
MQRMSFLFVLLISANAFAWNPFAPNDITEVALSKQELQKIKVNAGWAKDDDHTLIFELSNALKGPVQCGAANVDLNDGKSVGKVFM